MKHLLRAFAAACILVLGSSVQAALAKPPLEAFGELADIRSMHLSPDGTKVAYLQKRGDSEQVILLDLATKKAEPIATVGEFQARGVSFINDDYVALTATKVTRSTTYMTDRFQDTSSFAINIRSKKSVQLLTNTPILFPVQSGLHVIAGHDPGGKHVFMPAFTSDGRLTRPPRDLLRVSMDTGVGLATGGKSGSLYTRDWIIDRDGQVVAREDYNEENGEYVVFAYDGNRAREIHRRVDKEWDLSVHGVDADGSSLIVSAVGDGEFRSLYRMALSDGTISGPILSRENADVEAVIMDKGRRVAGVRYSGMFPDYELFDKDLDAEISSIQANLPQSSVAIDSWSRDWSRLLLYISGGELSERYALFDRKARRLDMLAEARPAIRAQDVGEVITIEYKASDGLTIPALVTWPARVAEADRKNLPLIVLPHGGPESYDAVGFDWLAQFFANEGYAVLQPNFRGSAGFGRAFAVAGYREWGRKMQSDITDGADALARMGWIDPERMCIVGWSYGGYAALAGGALTPDMYRCVVSIAGVANLREMLGEDKRRSGKDSLAFRYWTKLLGDINADRAEIEAISPTNLADRFKAPVLLVHGADDMVVAERQSAQMETALKRAGKDVTYLKLRGDDHSLSQSQNRRQALEAIGAFVNSHIGAR